MNIKTRFLVLLFIVSLAAAGSVQYMFDRQHDYFSQRNTFVALPSGNILKIISFGFDAITADFLHIWAIQFYSSPNLKNRFDFTERIFNTITDLAPDYKDPYHTGTLIMANEMGDFQASLRLYDKAIAQFPKEWTFYNEAGYYSYKYLKDNSRAEKYYDQAASLPDAPEFIRRHKAHMIYLQNDLSMAWQMWMDIYTNAKDVMDKTSAYNHLFQIKSEQDRQLLLDKIKEFQSQAGRLPRSLEELAARRLLPSIPKDFSGREYQYDPQTGEVKARQEFRWKRYR